MESSIKSLLILRDKNGKTLKAFTSANKRYYICISSILSELPGVHVKYLGLDLDNIL